MAQDHLLADRGWTLIRDKGQLTHGENEHLETCILCHEWLASFIRLAKISGFQVPLRLPELHRERSPHNRAIVHTLNAHQAEEQSV
jgi:hypothetical protein